MDNSRVGLYLRDLYAQGFSALEAAILETITYVDIFDYPPTIAEVQRYLIGLKATLPEIKNTLHKSSHLRDRLEEHDGFYTLSGRGKIVEKRREHSDIAGDLWPLSLQYGKIISTIPYVLMVAITGSLAVDNSEPGSDIDYFIVTKNDRLWLTRAMVILVVHYAARYGVRLCPNYFVSERALVLTKRNLYAARELVQMVPIYGFPVYDRLRKENCWVTNYLPNAAGPPRTVSVENGHKTVSTRLINNTMELTLNTPLGSWLDRWEMNRKVRKFNPLVIDDETAFSVDWCKGHFDSHGKKALELFELHMNEITH